MTQDENEAVQKLFILGRYIGTYEGWDEGEPGCIQFSGVKSNIENFPCGDIWVDYNKGNIIQYNDESDEVTTSDIISYVAHLPKEP